MTDLRQLHLPRQPLVVRVRIEGKALRTEVDLHFGLTAVGAAEQTFPCAGQVCRFNGVGQDQRHDHHSHADKPLHLHDPPLLSVVVVTP
ncbi:MAG: hypothetical protein E8D43_13735 [Nitrospira sp.]|nr:MAG: hypothetical protein E8D43_13735 [Nitrospira sp.]